MTRVSRCCAQLRRRSERVTRRGSCGGRCAIASGVRMIASRKAPRANSRVRRSGSSTSCAREGKIVSSSGCSCAAPPASTSATLRRVVARSAPTNCRAAVKSRCCAVSKTLRRSPGVRTSQARINSRDALVSLAARSHEMANDLARSSRSACPKTATVDSRSGCSARIFSVRSSDTSPPFGAVPTFSGALSLPTRSPKGLELQGMLDRLLQ